MASFPSQHDHHERYLQQIQEGEALIARGLSMISEARARYQGVVAAASVSPPPPNQTQPSDRTAVTIDETGTVALESHQAPSLLLDPLQTSPQAPSKTSPQGPKQTIYKLDPSLYLITPKDKYLVHVGARVNCQGRWGVVTKAYPDNSPPAVFIRLDDGSDANFANTICTFHKKTCNSSTMTILAPIVLLCRECYA